MLSLERRSTFLRALRCGVAYVGCVAAALTSALVVGHDFELPPGALALLCKAICIAAPIKLLLFYFHRLHRVSWHIASVGDVTRVAYSSGIGSALFAIANIGLTDSSFPVSVYVLDFVFCVVGLVGACRVPRVRREIRMSRLLAGADKQVLIYGAGSAGLTLLREIRDNASLRHRAVGFIDDDRKKCGAVLMGIPVLGTGRSVAQRVQWLRTRGTTVDEIIIALPSATGAQMQEALATCRSAGVACKTIPGLGELLTGKVLSAQVRKLRITDLLGRNPVELDDRRIRASLKDARVLVTGGAGSIGSELCRQIAGFGASKVVIFDQAESDLFRIDMELRETFPSLAIVPEIGDICELDRVEEVILKHHITHVFHAAAYKHVPMMEMHPLVAVRNNVIGTWNLTRAASRSGVRSFLMISSDKAVNPTSVMGATKRVAELIVASMPQSGTKFVSVRFGNVLASNGSVVNVFQDQIAKGGPVTVTHPEIRRYFMTIREAVQLALQASTMGHGSEIFVLDMGAPVKIVDLAESLIRLSGLTPHRDIAIRFTGLRPGEKRFEEIMTEAENILPTYLEKIKIFAGTIPDRARIESWMKQTRRVLHRRDPQQIIRSLTELVPEYQPSDTAAAVCAAPARVLRYGVSVRAIRQRNGREETMIGAAAHG